MRRPKAGSRPRWAASSYRRPTRYTAYVLGLHSYLLDTWHPNTRPAAIEADPPGQHWLGLEVRNCVDNSPDHSTVEFIARSKLGGGANRLHETSRFERVHNRWFYLDELNSDGRAG
jgi:SEC-C motif-containing protein